MRSLRLWSWYVRNLDGVTSPNTLRARMAVSMHQVAAEHQSAMAILLNRAAPRAGSALALVRPALEALLLGLWVTDVADNAFLDKMARRQADPPSLDKLLRAVDRSGFAGEPLHATLQSQLDALNGFTHGGIWHIEARQSGERIGANYSEAQIVAGLRLGDLSGAMAALEMARISGDQSLGERMYRQASEIMGFAQGCDGE